MDASVRADAIQVSDVVHTRTILTEILRSNTGPHSLLPSRDFLGPLMDEAAHSIKATNSMAFDHMRPAHAAFYCLGEKERPPRQG